MFSNFYNCRICPHKCGKDRRINTGFCQSGTKLKINTWQKHFGEEPVISGTRGSGTIFFSNCNLKCVFCQNYQISQLGWGQEYSISELAEIMLELQRSGVHNINFVSPTHFSLQIREAILIAKKRGLEIPLVWNSNAYELPETLKMMDGLVDIYMPDFKYFSPENGYKYSWIKDYPKYANLSLKEMHRQAGNLQFDENDIAIKGVLIRLLMLPENKNGIAGILKWIAEYLGNHTFISLMAQYYPTYKANEYPEINSSITSEEYQFAAEICEDLGFENGYFQGMRITPEQTPKFKKEK